MAWYLALQGSPAKGGQAQVYELQETADREQLAQELLSAATLDRVVAVPAIIQNNRQRVTLYVRPAAWGAWVFYQMSEQERREMMAAASANPLLNALSQAAKQQQAQNPQG